MHTIAMPVLAHISARVNKQTKSQLWNLWKQYGSGGGGDDGGGGDASAVRNIKRQKFN